VSVAADQNTALLQYRVAQLERERQTISNYSLGTIMFKMNRERRRVKNKIKALARRLAGTPAAKQRSSRSH